MSSRGHSAIIIRAFSQATTSNAELLNRAHINILFLHLLIIRRPNIEAQRSFIYYQFDQSRPSRSPTQPPEERKKEKDGIGLHFTGLDLDTRNHYMNECLEETTSMDNPVHA